MTIRRKFAYIGTEIPPVSDGLEVGDEWRDTSVSPPVSKTCSSIDPVTFVETGGVVSPSHTIASHSDTSASGAQLDELVGGEQTALHKHKLNACDAPDGAVDFNKQQATALVIENRTDDPLEPVDGQIWLRADL